MVKFINRTYFLLFAFVFIGCNFNANLSYENEISERENAESVAGKLYWHLSKNELSQIPSLFGDSFFETSDTQGLLNFLTEKRNTCGQFKEYKLISWKTHRTTGTNPISQYLLVYDVQYTKQVATEEISLIKEEGKIMISGYRVSKK